MTKTGKKILYEKRGATAIITIKNPPVNALSSEVLSDLDTAIDNIAADLQLRSAVITAAESSVFSAGADIKELMGLSNEGIQTFIRQGQYLFNKIEGLPKVVIAAINGSCLGGGQELAISCDIRIASENAKFGQPEIKLGLMPGWGGTQRLPKLIGRTMALELLLTGEVIDSFSAFRCGMVNKVVPEGELLQEAEKMAGLFAENSQLSLQSIKKAVISEPCFSLDKGLAFEEECFKKIAHTDEAKEGMSNFISKRKTS